MKRRSRTPPPQKRKLTPDRKTQSRTRSKSQEALKENIPTTDTQVPIDKSESVVDQLFNLANKTSSEIADEKAKKISLALSKSNESVNGAREKKSLEKENVSVNGEKPSTPKLDSGMKDNIENKVIDVKKSSVPNNKDKPKSRSRSKSKEKSLSAKARGGSKSVKSPRKRKKSKTPPRITRPLSPVILPFRQQRGGRGGFRRDERGRGGFRRDDNWGPNYEGRDGRRGDFRGPDYRGQNWGGDYNRPTPGGPNFPPPEFGPELRGPNFRGPPPLLGQGPDYRPPDYPPPGPDYRAPDWAPPGHRSPNYPGLPRDDGFAGPPRDGAFPPIPRDDYGYAGRQVYNTSILRIHIAVCAIKCLLLSFL